MTERHRHTGRKRFAIDFWIEPISDRDPDWTSYSDDRDALVRQAEGLREHFANAILYERNFDTTPDWNDVESRYWHNLGSPWPIEV